MANVREMRTINGSSTNKEQWHSAVYDFAVEATGTQEVTSITTVADVAASLDQKYFVMGDEAGTVAFWIDVDDSGTAAPVHGADRAVEITTIATGDADTVVATKVAAAIHADSKFTAAAVGAVITATLIAPEGATDAVDGDTGFTIVVSTQGVDPDFTLFTAGEDLVITDFYAEVLTACTSGGSATMDLGIGSTGTQLWSNKAVANLAIGTIHTWDTKSIIKFADTNTLQFRVEVAALTAGKIRFWVKIKRFN